MTIKESVEKTVAYSRIFDYPLTLKEVHFWLVSSKKTSLSQLPQKLVPQLSEKQKLLKKKRLQISIQKKRLVSKLLAPLKKVPLLWFIGLTGSVSASNAKVDDDLDIFIITAPFSLWLVRPVILMYLSLIGVRRNYKTPKKKANNLVCPNLWVDYFNLQVSTPKQNLYTAHEVLQVVPLIDKYNTYQNFISQNSWTKNFLANAYPSKFSPVKLKEVSLLYSLLAPFNLLSLFFQFLIMFPHKKKEFVSPGRAYFYDPGFQQTILKNLT